MAVQPRARTIVLTLCSALLATATAALPARAEAPEDSAAPASWEVRGPHGSPTAVVALDDDGRPTLTVRRAGRTVLEPSAARPRHRAGGLLQGLDLHRPHRPHGQRALHHPDRQVPPARCRMTESRFRFRTADGARLDLLTRVAAGRRRLPLRPAGRPRRRVREASAFTFPADAEPSQPLPRGQRESPSSATSRPPPRPPGSTRRRPSSRRTAATPCRRVRPDRRLRRRPLTHAAGSPTYGVRLWNDEPVQTDGPLTTPWRAVVTGDLATVTESTFTDDLAPTSRVRDTSWIKPGPALWTWLAGGKEAGQSLEAQKKYVDYAAERGWPYEVVDAGWYFEPGEWDVIDPDWQTNSWMPELVRYAKERRVEIQVWLHYTRSRHRRGARAVAAHAGEVGREGREDRLHGLGGPGAAALVRRDPAGHRRAPPAGQLPRLHDPQGHPAHLAARDDAGGRRRRGEAQRTRPQHLAALPFTRNVIGSMDFTPGRLPPPEPPQPSDAGELGLSVLYESGIQNLAGTPESYDARPEARRYLEQLPDRLGRAPGCWPGDPASSAVLARRSRRPLVHRRYVRGRGPARVDVPLRLGAGKWLVETVTDGPSGLVREPHVVRGGDTLTVPSWRTAASRPSPAAGPRAARPATAKPNRPITDTKPPPLRSPGAGAAVEPVGISPCAGTCSRSAGPGSP